MNVYLVPNQQMLPRKGSGKNEGLHRGELSHTEMSGFIGELFRGMYILQSFAYVDAFTERILIPNCKSFLLDSGAFTFLSKGRGGVDWDRYCAAYIDFINRNKINLFFELDIDSVVGLREVERLRQKIEDGTGKKSIPVFHVQRGKDYFVDMCKEYNYVAFGGLGTDGVSLQKIVAAMPWFVDTAHEYGAKIHGLGFTNIKHLPHIHFDSVDSSSWSCGNRYGAVYKFDGKQIVTYKKPPGQKIANHQALALHNFTEWKKFQQYAEKYL